MCEAALRQRLFFCFFFFTFKQQGYRNFLLQESEVNSSNSVQMLGLCGRGTLMTDMRMEKNTVKQIEKNLGKERERKSVCVRGQERDGLGF